MRMDIDYVVDKFSDTIYRVALSTTKNPTESEDIVSEVLMKYFDKCKMLDFSDDEHLKAWLIRVTVNLCKDLFRSARYRYRSDLDENLSTDFDNKEQQTDVKNAIESLDKKYRLVLYLYYYEQYSTEEIAQILHTRNGTIVSRLSRAREKLRVELKDYDVNGRKEKEVGV